MTQPTRKIWKDGTYLDADNATRSVLEHGLHMALESLRVFVVTAQTTAPLSFAFRPPPPSRGCARLGHARRHRTVV